MDNKWHLIVDTSFLQANRFLWGKRIVELNNLVYKDLVKIYITDVILRELKKHMIEKLEQEESDIRKTTIFHELYPKEHKCINNIGDSTLKVDEAINNWIKKNGVEVLSSKTVDMEEVLNMYFLNQKPFGVSGKRKEFPDAIIYNVCKQYFSSGYDKVYMVTKDKDLLEVKDDVIRFIHSDQVGDLYSDVLKEWDEDAAIEYIEGEFLLNANLYVEEIERYIADSIKDEIKDRYINDTLDEIFVEFISQAKDEKFQTTLFDLEQDSAELEYSFSSSALIQISGENYDSAIYDKEDGMYVNVLPIRNNYETQIFVRAYFEVDNLNAAPCFKLYKLEARETYYGTSFSLYTI